MSESDRRCARFVGMVPSQRGSHVGKPLPNRVRATRCADGVHVDDE